MNIAITRPVSTGIAQCELTHLSRQPIDLGKAQAQHRAYQACLAELGCEIISLLPAPDQPDAVFVEDTAVVLDELAVITHPGARSRRPETTAVASALRPYRDLVFIQPPGIMDGGDVLRIGKKIYVGLSNRTNLEAIEQLRTAVAEQGYTVSAVDMRGCLHLKSAVTLVQPGLLLINPEWVAPDNFPGMHFIEVASEEPQAANVLLIGDTAVFPAQYPRTIQRLQDHDIPLRCIELSELIKAEGAVTCCSIIFKQQP